MEVTVLYITYDVNEIIQKLVEEKKEENGKIIYPALRELFAGAKNTNCMIVVCDAGKRLDVNVCDLKNEGVQRILKESNIKPEHNFHD
jgi:hypothetical protein